MAAGEIWEEQDLVFTTATGGPLRGNHILQRHFEPLCKRLGLPRIRLHDLRHTTATLLLKAKVPTEVVSRTLGHSSTSVTSDIYMHVTSEMQEEAVAELDRLFGSKPSRSERSGSRAPQIKLTVTVTGTPMDTSIRQQTNKRAHSAWEATS